mgnify:CR=1 FL=1
MSEQRIKKLMSELLLELDQAENVKDETATIARQLESDIDDLVNPQLDTAENTVLDDAIALEAVFAVSHPVAEKILRELINNLSKIGI